MSVNLPATSVAGRTIEIVWEKSPFSADDLPALDRIEHGYVGDIKAFSITTMGRRATLHTHLLSESGAPRKRQECASTEQAKQVADEILNSFLRAFLAKRPPSKV